MLRPRLSSFKILIAVSMVITLFLATSLPALAAGQASAKLTAIKGKVYVKKSGGQREFNAFDGMRLTEGDLIRTGENSSAQIVYDNGSETVLTLRL
jgi:hypothetical protein